MQPLKAVASALLAILLALAARDAGAGDPPPGETAAGWLKYEDNPVLGGSLGTCFDVSVLRDGALFRMWFSWRPRKSIALVESRDGIHWSEPVVVLGPAESGWENEVNRPAVLRRPDGYHLWYTGQVWTGGRHGRSCIGYATSRDGRTWTRASPRPVLSPDLPWENEALMCPSVVWDEKAGIYRMWYSGGEQWEPNAIGYAASPDGIAWTRAQSRPVFANDPAIGWERDRVTGCQVIRQADGFLMFYIGFRDIDHAQIGIARSRDGLSGWERLGANPIVRPGVGKWDHDACYKPYAILDGTRWLLWYNGRHDDREQIGLVVHEGPDLGFGRAP
jgi:predicted GH43/DUF377 family glycosyl hydrolase